MTSRANFITITAQDGCLAFHRTPQNLIADTTYPSVTLANLQEDGCYGTALIWQTTEPAGWRKAQPLIVTQKWLTTYENHTECYRLTFLDSDSPFGSTSFVKIMTAQSVNADTGAAGNFDEIQLGTVLLCCDPGDTIREYRIIGTLGSSDNTPFVLSDAFGTHTGSPAIPGVECVYGIALKMDYETLTIRANATEYTYPVSDSTPVTTIDTEYIHEKEIARPTSIQSIIPLEISGASTNQMASAVLAYSCDGVLQSLIHFLPVLEFNQDWENCALNIATKVLFMNDAAGNPICKMNYVSNGTPAEKTAVIRSSTIDADTGKNVAPHDIPISTGTVFIQQADFSGNVASIRIIGSIEEGDTNPFMVNAPYQDNSHGIPQTTFGYGYIKELPSSNRLIIQTAGGRQTLTIDSSVHTYCVNQTNPRNPRVEVGRLCGSEPYNGEVSYVFYRMKEEQVTDIIGFAS